MTTGPILKVTVLEKLESPAIRGTVNRDRSYPVDITARGMAALAQVGVVGEEGAIRKSTLPFIGHMGPFGPHALNTPGLIGTRDDIVLGLLNHISETSFPGTVDVEHEVAVCGVDLQERSIVLEGGEKRRFDLMVAADGKWLVTAAFPSFLALSARHCRHRGWRPCPNNYVEPHSGQCCVTWRVSRILHLS